MVRRFPARPQCPHAVLRRSRGRVGAAAELNLSWPRGFTLRYDSGCPENRPFLAFCTPDRFV